MTKSDSDSASAETPVGKQVHIIFKWPQRPTKTLLTLGIRYYDDVVSIISTALYISTLNNSNNQV